MREALRNMELTAEPRAEPKYLFSFKSISYFGQRKRAEISSLYNIPPRSLCGFVLGRGSSCLVAPIVPDSGISRLAKHSGDKNPSE